jgi:Ser/Thr protein kinase RdoA (MazF antagonist)
MMQAFPRRGRLAADMRTALSRPPLDRTVVASLLEPYGLALTSRVRNASAGSRNPVVVANTNLGRVVVKRYPDRWATETIVHEHSILNRLAQLDFPAVRAVETVSGSSWVEHPEGRFVVFEHVTGTSYAGYRLSPGLRDTLMDEAARLLVDLQQQLADFWPEGRHHLGHDHDDGSRHRDTAWLLEVLDRAEAAHQNTTTDLTWLVDDADRIRSTLVETGDALDAAALPTTVIHGDFGIHNLIFSDLHHPVVHDFELARRDWRLVDLAITVARLRPPAATSFLAAYRTHAGIDDAEWRLFPTVWRHYHLIGAIQGLYTFMEHGGDHRLAAARLRHSNAFNQPPWMREWL